MAPLTIGFVSLLEQAQHGLLGSLEPSMRWILGFLGAALRFLLSLLEFPLRWCLAFAASASIEWLRGLIVRLLAAWRARCEHCAETTSRDANPAMQPGLPAAITPTPHESSSGAAARSKKNQETGKEVRP